MCVEGGEAGPPSGGTCLFRAGFPLCRETSGECSPERDIPGELLSVTPLSNQGPEEGPPQSGWGNRGARDLGCL